MIDILGCGDGSSNWKIRHTSRCVIARYFCTTDSDTKKQGRHSYQSCFWLVLAPPYFIHSRFVVFTQYGFFPQRIRWDLVITDKEVRSSSVFIWIGSAQPLRGWDSIYIQRQCLEAVVIWDAANLSQRCTQKKFYPSQSEAWSWSTSVSKWALETSSPPRDLHTQLLSSTLTILCLCPYPPTRNQ